MTGRLFAVGLLLLAFPAVQAQKSPAPVITNLLIFAGTDAGLYRSRDWGGSWEKVASGLEGLGRVTSVLAPGPAVYAAGEGGFYASDDFGETWKVVYAEQPILAMCMSRFPTSDPTLFLGTAKGLLKSPDLGRTVLPTSLKGIPVLRIEWPGPDLVVVTGGGVVVSKDSGRSFEIPGVGLPGGETPALALSSYYASDPMLFASPEGLGVFRSEDGAKHWKPAGLSGRRVSDLLWFGKILYAATDQGLFKTENGGEEWIRLGQGLDGVLPQAILFPLAPASGSEAFLGSTGGVYRSADGGASWGASGLKERNVAVLATFPPPKDSRKRH